MGEPTDANCKVCVRSRLRVERAVYGPLAGFILGLCQICMFTVLDVVTLECAYWSVADARLACATPEKFKVFELGGLAWRQVMTLGLSRQSGVPLCWSCQ